jgi:rod shape-determining protein MreD
MSPVLLLPLIYLASALETLQSARWQIAGVGPDLVALAAFAWLARAKGRYAFAVAALIGLANDLISAAPLGLNVAVYAVVAYSLTRLRARMDLDHFAGRLAIIFLGVASTCFVQTVALRIFKQTTLPWLMLLPRSALVGFYTAGVAVPIVMLAGWLRSPRPTIELNSG